MTFIFFLLFSSFSSDHHFFVGFIKNEKFHHLLIIINLNCSNCLLHIDQGFRGDFSRSILSLYTPTKMTSSSSFLPLIPFEIPIFRRNKQKEHHKSKIHPLIDHFIYNTNSSNLIPKFVALNSPHSSPFPIASDSPQPDLKFPPPFSHIKTLESPVLHDPIHIQDDQAVFPWSPGETLERIFRETPRFDLPSNARESIDVARKKYNNLRRRQVKAEAEAWEKAAEEYKELERVMLEKKLAPNLPYVKNLFLGWFEPLRSSIERDLKLEKGKRHKAAYAHHLSLLPADKLAVIVMHKMMGLLMMGQEEGCVRVVQAAIHIGEAVEQEVYDCVLCLVKEVDD